MSSFCCDPSRYLPHRTPMLLIDRVLAADDETTRCRVTVGGQMKFACVDGPDFDGQLIDWDEAIARSRMYKKEEQQSLEHGSHACNLKNIELQKQRGGAD